MRAQMTMMDVVRELQRQGHQVDFYVRKDGGILVKSIDGVKYPSGASGNAVARQMVGVQISEARIKQLKYATKARKRKRAITDDEVKKAYDRAKKIWNKAFKAKKGKPSPQGYFPQYNIKWILEHYGKEEALRRIKEAEKYASGLAYTKNIEHLAFFIRDAGEKYNSQELIKLSEDIITYAYTIKEEWIKPAYDELYLLNQGVPPEEVARNTRMILRL